MSNPTKEQQEKLLQLMRDAFAHDKALREKYQVGEKFRFIRDRLESAVKKVEESIAELQKASAQQEAEGISADETLVYVYIFNAQGLVLQTWQKMLSPTVFYEYSVNRPVYLEKAHVESAVRSKANKVQHAYLTIAVRTQDILPPVEIEAKDSIGNPLIKVKEGSLKITRLFLFTHNGVDYKVTDDGRSIKKVE